MFSPLAENDRGTNRTLAGSLVVHFLLLIWILLPPRAIFISPSSAKAGVNGTGVAYLYFPAKSDETQQEQSSATRHLILQREAKAKKQKRPEKLTPLQSNEAAAVASSAPPSGSAYGSSLVGSPIGQEVRPALRVKGSEPAVNPSEFAGLEGNVVIEITIDDQGKIVEKNLLQSLSPAVDQKVLAALEDWHFLPATRDGVAIPSKEDVYYHFPVRR
jgi:TonB family protein